MIKILSFWTPDVCTFLSSFRQYRLERELTSKLWKVSVTDLVFLNCPLGSKSSLTDSETSIDSMVKLLFTFRPTISFGIV